MSAELLLEVSCDIRDCRSAARFPLADAKKALRMAGWIEMTTTGHGDLLVSPVHICPDCAGELSSQVKGTFDEMLSISNMRAQEVEGSQRVTID
jgi:hypothetical protein